MTARVPRQFQPLARLAREQGWAISHLHSGHLVWKGPDGQKVHSSLSPSNVNAVHDLGRDLARAGLDIPGRPPGPEKPPAPVPVPPSTAPELPELPQPASGPQEAALRELVSEARVLLRELRRERKAVEDLISSDVRELVTAEVVRQLTDPEGQFQGEIHGILAHVQQSGQEGLDELARIGAKLDRIFTRKFHGYWREAEEMLESFRLLDQHARDLRAARVVPAAFQKNRTASSA